MPSLIDVIDQTDIDRVTLPLERAFTLPPQAYTQANVFDLETEEIFFKDWVCIAREEEVPEPGDYICVDLPRQPLVLSRDLTGQLHALSRICLHRAMPVAEGSGNATRFVCPYHNWTYELDGALRSAPMMDGVEGFDVKACRLPEVRLEIWNGFVFVNMNAEAEPLAPQLSGLNSLVADYHFEDLVIAETLEFDSPWNWKILVENFMEAYHHIGPHKNTFERDYPARDSYVVDNKGAPWTFLNMPGGERDEDEVSSFPDISADQRQSLFAANVYPTLMFAASNSGGAWYQAMPRAHDQMDLKIHILLHREIAAHLGAEDREMMRTSFEAIHREDIGVNEGPWRGLNSELSKQGRLSTFEKAIWQLNQLWVERVSRKDP